MAPIPSPYFPEPVSVPGNVAAQDYHTVVRFTRRVALINLASVGFIALVTWGLAQPAAVEILAGIGAEVTWLTALAALVALALLRHSVLVLQVLAFLFLAFFLGAVLAELAPFLSDEFPDFMKTFAFTSCAAWLGLMLYNVLAARDYSMSGEFVLVAAFVAVLLTIFTVITDVWLSQAFAVYIVLMSLLFYWLYDLAMVLRRRTPSQPLQAALDLYRDLLNFIGFPVRVMRMPRGRRRFQT